MITFRTILAEMFDREAYFLSIFSHAITASLIIFVFCFPSASKAQSWEYEYVVGKDSTEITSCNARIAFSDGLVLARIYGEELDFYFGNVELSLPVLQKLGNVAFKFKSNVFVLSAESSNGSEAVTSSMFLTPLKADYSSILSAIRVSDSMEVIFPDSTYYSVPLNNSDVALELASKCWTEKPTGPAGKNPFSGATGGGKNPFN